MHFSSFQQMKTPPSTKSPLIRQSIAITCRSTSGNAATMQEALRSYQRHEPFPLLPFDIPPPPLASSLPASASTSTSSASTASATARLLATATPSVNREVDLNQRL